MKPRRTAFSILLPAHDHVWRSDLPLRDRLEAASVIWRAIILQSLEGEIPTEGFS